MLRSTLRLATLVCLAASPVLADDAPTREDTLPGVDGSYSIVKPAPEPGEPTTESTETRKVGHWELTVSGYVWVQVGASSRD